MHRAIIGAMNTVATLAKSFINLIYPLHCASCSKPLEAVNELGVCAFCQAEIKRNPRPYCDRCGRSIENAPGPCPECVKMQPLFSRAYSACLYEGSLKELIHAFKYKNRRSLSGLFTDLLLDFINDNPDVLDGIDVITFVPIHRKRLNERGFNQSELLASCLGKAVGIPVKNFLEKRQQTKNQNELSREERLCNINGTTCVNPEAALEIKGVGVLIVDDVMTTGSTLNESSRALLAAGAREVRCLSLARGLLA